MSAWRFLLVDLWFRQTSSHPQTAATPEVIAIDKDPVKVQLARHNGESGAALHGRAYTVSRERLTDAHAPRRTARIYGVEERITFINADFLEWALDGSAEQYSADV